MNQVIYNQRTINSITVKIKSGRVIQARKGAMSSDCMDPIFREKARFVPENGEFMT